MRRPHVIVYDLDFLVGWSTGKRLAAAAAVGLVILGAVLVPPLPLVVWVASIAVAMLIGGFAAWAAWGRDPIVLDDDSILAAGPPADLRPCLAVLLYDGRGGDRSMRVAILELAVRGLLEIHDDPLLGDGAYIPRTWIDVKRHDDVELEAPEQIVATALGSPSLRAVRLDYVDVLTALGSARLPFEAAVDRDLVAAGWYGERPYRTGKVWLDGAEVVVVAGIAGAVLAVLGALPPLLFAYAGLVAAGMISRQFAQAMPARTASGAMVAAMLKAYRRTLGKTLAVADSVWDVIGVHELAWFRTPDRMVLWAMALDLETELSAMFARANVAGAGEPWFPAWFGTTVADPTRTFRSLDRLTRRVERRRRPSTSQP